MGSHHTLYISTIERFIYINIQYFSCLLIICFTYQMVPSCAMFTIVPSTIDLAHSKNKRSNCLFIFSELLRCQYCICKKYYYIQGIILFLVSSILIMSQCYTSLKHIFNVENQERCLNILKEISKALRQIFKA